MNVSSIEPHWREEKEENFPSDIQVQISMNTDQNITGNGVIFFCLISDKMYNYCTIIILYLLLTTLFE